jgi:hypothetical protein
MGQPAARERERVYMERCSVAEWEDWKTGLKEEVIKEPLSHTCHPISSFSFLVVVTFSRLVGWDESERSGRAGRFYKCGWRHCTGGLRDRSVAHDEIKNKFKVNHFQAQEEEKSETKNEINFFSCAVDLVVRSFECGCEGREQGKKKQTTNVVVVVVKVERPKRRKTTKFHLTAGGILGALRERV